MKFWQSAMLVTLFHAKTTANVLTCQKEIMNASVHQGIMEKIVNL